MTPLGRDAAAAREAGLSYGKWRATQRNGETIQERQNVITFHLENEKSVNTARERNLDIRKILEEYSRCGTIKQVSENAGVSVFKIRKILEKLYLPPIRTMGGNAPNQDYRKLDESWILFLERKYWEMEKTNEQKAGDSV